MARSLIETSSAFGVETDAITTLWKHRKLRPAPDDNSLEGFYHDAINVVGQILFGTKLKEEKQPVTGIERTNILTLIDKAERISKSPGIRRDYETEEEVNKAFAENASPYAERFVPALAPLILRVLRDPKFPKREPKPRKGTLKPRKPKPNQRINFLADSLAGVGVISPSRSRDICAAERTKRRAKSKHHIIRHEFYVECSCGYKGPARDNACRKCGAEIPPSFGGLLASGLF